jgi:hypothetical protein
MDTWPTPHTPPAAKLDIMNDVLASRCQYMTTCEHSGCGAQDDAEPEQASRDGVGVGVGVRLSGISPAWSGP